MADAYKTDGLTNAQRNFLLRHAGDKLTADKAQHYVDGHNRAVAAKLKIDSPKYFRSIAEHVDSLSGSRKVAADQPKPSGPRYDGASVPKPRHVGGGDEFQKLRSRASSGGRYGTKT